MNLYLGKDKIGIVPWAKMVLITLGSEDGKPVHLDLDPVIEEDLEIAESKPAPVMGLTLYC